MKILWFPVQIFVERHEIPLIAKQNFEQAIECKLVTILSLESMLKNSNFCEKYIDDILHDAKILKPILVSS